MIRFFARRVALGLVSLLVFLFALFIVIELAVPGDVATPLRLGMTEQEVDEVREQIGVSRPLPVRFFDWLSAFASGDIQITSFRGPDGDNVFAALPATLLVFAVGLAIAYALGTRLGRISAWRPGFLSGGMTVLGVVAYSIFPPFLAFGLTRGIGRQTREFFADVTEGQEDPWHDAVLTENQVMLRLVALIGVTWLVVTIVRRLIERRRRRQISSLLTLAAGVGIFWVLVRVLGLRWMAIDLAEVAALPILGFTILSFGEFLLVTKTAMDLSLHDDYVLTARAKGLKPSRIRDHHVARNANIVVAIRMAVSLPYLLTGLVIIETALSYPGVGAFMFRAIENQDLPAVMSGLAVVGILALGIRLFIDMASAWADPRIKDGLAEELVT